MGNRESETSMLGNIVKTAGTVAAGIALTLGYSGCTTTAKNAPSARTTQSYETMIARMREAFEGIDIDEVGSEKPMTRTIQSYETMIARMREAFEGIDIDEVGSEK